MWPQSRRNLRPCCRFGGIRARMRRFGGWRRIALVAVAGLWPFASAAQTVDDRFSGLGLRPTASPWSILAAKEPSLIALPSSVPMPRPVRRDGASRTAEDNVPRARQEEL